MFNEILYRAKSWLEKIDERRDRLLFPFIKRYWPRAITPNHLSYLRLGIGVLLFILLFYYDITHKTLIVSLFCFGCITDLFDGSVARALGMETDAGAVLDPAADRFFITPIALYSLWTTHKWLLLTLFLLEVANMAVSMQGPGQKLLLKHNIFWKVKMIIYFSVFIAILVFWPLAPHSFFIGMLWFSMIFTAIGIFVRIKEGQHAK